MAGMVDYHISLGRHFAYPHMLIDGGRGRGRACGCSRVGCLSVCGCTGVRRAGRRGLPPSAAGRLGSRRGGSGRQHRPAELSRALNSCELPRSQPPEALPPLPPTPPHPSPTTPLHTPTPTPPAPTHPHRHLARRRPAGCDACRLCALVPGPCGPAGPLLQQPQLQLHRLPQARKSSLCSVQHACGA
jgi:hypothetical protein